jgi:signal transduction histidine kinase
MPPALVHSRIARNAALLVACSVTLHTLLTVLGARAADARLVPWAALFILYCFALWRSFSEVAGRRSRILLLAIQALAPYLMAQLIPCAYTPLLDLIVAWQAALLLSLPVAVAWLTAQSGLMLAVIVRSCSVELRGMAEVFLGFQGFVFITALVTQREAKSRLALARVNAELCAAREMLRDSTRLAERNRIARDLHDVIGHHLTALSLQLEAAAHTTTGKSNDHLGTARGIAKEMMQEVRAVVAELRADDGIDLARTLATLIAGVVGVRVHLDLPSELRIDCPNRAQTLVRCVQEIVTNTLKHAAAKNLWIAVRVTATGIELHARDDGRGARGRLVPGLGLRGMQERFEQLGGRVRASRASEGSLGFAVQAWLPLEAPAA